MDELFPEDKIRPDVLSRLTPAEAIALRFTLSRRPSGIPRGGSDAYYQLMNQVFRKLQVHGLYALIQMAIVDD